MMRPPQRLAVARLVYVRVLGLARAETSPATWRRLLRAASNLRAAVRDCEDEHLGAAARPGPEPRDYREHADLLAFPEATRLRRTWSPEVVQQLSRARTLMAQARGLQEEARALRASLAALALAPRGPSARSPSS